MIPRAHLDNFENLGILRLFLFICGQYEYFSDHVVGDLSPLFKGSTIHDNRLHLTLVAHNRGCRVSGADRAAARGVTSQS